MKCLLQKSVSYVYMHIKYAQRQTCIWVNMMLMQHQSEQVYLPSHLCHL